MQTSERIFYTRALALVALLLLGHLLYLVLSPLFAPLAWSLFIAFLIYPLQGWLARKLGGRDAWTAALLTLGVFLVVIGPLGALAAAFAAQVADLARYAQAFAVGHKPSDLSDVASLPLVGPAARWLQEATGISLAQIQAWAVEAAQVILKALGALGREAFLGALGTVVGFALMMFILFFAIRDGKRMADTVRALLPAEEKDKERLFGHLASVTRALVYGAGVTAIVQGALVGIGFAAVGLPSPVVFGVIATLASLVPLLGTPIVWVPAVIVLAVQDRFYAALFMALWGGVVVTIDNFLRPWLVSGRARIDALTVFIGVLGGVHAFGVIGVFLGPLVLALGIALVRFALETRPAGS